MTVTAPPLDVRVVSRPGPDDENPYFRLMYAALEKHGVRHAGTFMVNDRWLVEHAHEFDALHLHWPEWIWRVNGRSRLRLIAGLYRYLALARRLGLIRLWTVHNLFPHERQLPDVPGFWLLARQIDLFVCHSRHAERRLRKWLHPFGPTRTVIMPHGNYDGAYPPPADPSATRITFGLPDGRPVIGLIGQMRRYKGLETALDAIGRIGERAHLIIAGRPAAEMAPLLDRAAAMPGVVTVVDRALTPRELADLLGAVDVAWLPYARITGSGALLLALTAGVPVAASDLPFFREILDDMPSAGRLVPRGDGEALARVTHDLLSSPRDDRRAAARRLAERYSWASCTQPLADAIRRLLADRQLANQEYA